MESKLQRCRRSKRRSYYKAFNRTSMESKLLLFRMLWCPLWLLLIEPVWNRNIGTPRVGLEETSAFNRTSMESKLGFSLLWAYTLPSLRILSQTRLLIEPVWNRNADHDFASGFRSYESASELLIEPVWNRNIDRAIRYPSTRIASLLIEPVWNRNGGDGNSLDAVIHFANQYRKTKDIGQTPGFNRTSMESKTTRS